MIFYINGQKIEGSWITIDENGFSIDGSDKESGHLEIRQNATLVITVINCSEATDGGGE